MKYLQDNYSAIKNCFTYLAGLSMKSCLGMREFMNFVDQTKMKDASLTREIIDDLFVEVNKDPNAEETENENPTDELVRYEFVEMLIRMADFKYKRTGEVNQHAHAFGKLFSSIVEPWYRSETEVWGGFRSNELQTLAVDELLRKNRASFERLYKKYVDLQ